MNLYLSLILSGVIGYLIGSLNFAIIFSFLTQKEDIRLLGSKNAGMTNVIRNHGALAGIPVFLGDFLKSIAAIYLCRFLFNSVEGYFAFGHLIVGLMVVIGHMHPVYFNFKGGKGIATSAGLILTQNIKFFFVVVLVFALTLLITRIVGLASVCAAISYPISTLIFFDNYLMFILSVILSSLVIFAHRSNIKKIVKQFKSKK